MENRPIPYQKMSRKNAIGKKFIEKYFQGIFINARGSVILSDGTRTKCPRYYEKWLKKNHPDLWASYVTQTKHINTERLREKAEQEHKIFLEEREKTSYPALYDSPLKRKRIILTEKIKRLKRTHL